MVSDKKRLEIANTCYANVSGQFAMFCNQKMRGPNFKWSEFANIMARQADMWMFVHNIKGKKSEINELAIKFSREIAERLVKEAGFIEE